MKRAKEFIARCLPLLLACFLASPASGQEETPFARLFDTGVSSAEPLTEEALAQRTGWKVIPEDQVDHVFSGDAVWLNDKLAIVLRKQGRGAEVYSKIRSGLKHRATLGLVGASAPVIASLDALKIIENTSGAVMVEASYKGASPAAMRFRLTTGEAILEIRPGAGAQSVVVSTKTRYVVVPDYFGDDLVFGAESFRGLYLPAENFCLNLLDGGEALMMTVWQSSQQDVSVTTASIGNQAGLCSNVIQCLMDKSIWLAFFESPGLWHAGNASVKQDWKPPFPAKWRYGLVRENGVADSWTTEEPDGARAARSADVRPRPLDQAPAKRAGDRAPNAERAMPPGLLVVYPIDRSTATPLTVSCPTDVMRNTLGVGPCQYILACEGLGSQGDPTPNSVMNWVEKQFEQKKEKKSAADIQERLDQMAKHLAEARTRIERYAEFAGQVRKLLATRPGSDPVRLILDDLDRLVAIGLAPATSPERGQQWATEVMALVGQENALASCQRLGEQLRSLGAVQDRTLAKCRMTVRRLKQQGRTLAASEANLAGELQRLAESMLQVNPVNSSKEGKAKP